MLKKIPLFLKIVPYEMEVEGLFVMNTSLQENIDALFKILKLPLDIRYIIVDELTGLPIDPLKTLMDLGLNHPRCLCLYCFNS